MDKEFIGYTESLELKELGFDEPCIAFYKDNKISGCKYPDEDSQFDVCTNTQMKEYKNSDKYCSAPLYQQAFRWFREKYNLKKDYGIFPHYTIMFNYILDGGNEEKAELECLKKLIEIVKNK